MTVDSLNCCLELELVNVLMMILIYLKRVIAPDTPNYPTHALHVYRLNDAVDKRNVYMLNSLASENDQYTINACDSVAGQTRHIDLSNLSDKIRDW